MKHTCGNNNYNAKVECTIPIWLKELAEKNNIDCSALLREALEAKVTETEVSDYYYPDEMNMILEHLDKVGLRDIPGKKVEDLYREFSDSHYCAGWMAVDEEILEEFTSYAATAIKSE